MAVKQDLTCWVLEALDRLGGEAHLVDVAKDIWAHREAQLRESGDLFFTWQYDMRWAATKLRHDGQLAAASGDGRWKTKD